MRVDNILETCLCVNDLDEAERFYSRVLGLPPVDKRTARHVFFRCGNRMLLLFNPEESVKPGDLPPHGVHGAGHLAFGVREADISAWREHLTLHNVPIEQEFSWPGGFLSLYFRDPSGNLLELVSPGIWGISEQTLPSP